MTTTQINPARSQQVTDAKIELLGAIPELDTNGLESLRAFLHVIHANRGNAQTPIEHFIATLPQFWESCEEMKLSLTPDRIIDMIEAPEDGVRAWFNDAVAITRDFNARYARIVTAEAVDISKTAEADDAEEI